MQSERTTTAQKWHTLLGEGLGETLLFFLAGGGGERLAERAGEIEAGRF